MSENTLAESFLSLAVIDKVFNNEIPPVSY